MPPMRFCPRRMSTLLILGALFAAGCDVFGRETVRGATVLQLRLDRARLVQPGGTPWDLGFQNPAPDLFVRVRTLPDNPFLVDEVARTPVAANASRHDFPLGDPGADLTRRPFPADAHVLVEVYDDDTGGFSTSDLVWASDTLSLRAESRDAEPGATRVFTLGDDSTQVAMTLRWEPTDGR